MGIPTGLIPIGSISFPERFLGRGLGGLCAEAVVAFSSSGAVLASFFDFYLDVITTGGSPL